MQSIPAPPSSPTSSSPTTSDRKRIIWTAGGFMVPTSQGSSKLKMTPVPLIRKKKTLLSAQGEQDATEPVSTDDLELPNENMHEDQSGAPEDAEIADIAEEAPKGITDTQQV
ncbi:hypothetical protein EUX98_g2121 [Antrodiella citrinella]|uniref:Uncharacterized protein n=1 Tax=Antrodiella citrinella TaxID=2447956 RepID=A0A4S4N2V3_9APHY|nr:hypothetical protein EUX98_g2121 [Antrodiella citrinella]